jgi:hypothetical protein
LEARAADANLVDIGFLLVAWKPPGVDLELAADSELVATVLGCDAEALSWLGLRGLGRGLDGRGFGGLRLVGEGGGCNQGREDWGKEEAFHGVVLLDVRVWRR